MSFVETAKEHWGDELPDWVRRLAEEADATSQNRVARRVGYTAGALSSVFRCRYGASMAGIEEQVRGVLMKKTVTCPVLGEIGAHDCRAWRGRARSFSSHNALSVRMFRACKACPMNKGGEQDAST